MQVQSGMQAGMARAEFSVGVQEKAQDTSAKLVNDLFGKSLEGLSETVRASQGVGTNLNVVA